MKKIILTLSAAFLAIGLYANPNPYPEIHINELMFTGTGTWSIELKFYYCDLGSFDSIFLQSLSGTSRIFSFHGYPMPYFTQQDLLSSLSINPDGDVITVTGFRYSYPWASTLRFGNVTNAAVRAPSLSQSIQRFETWNDDSYYYENDVFALSNNPTIGLPNDTTGTCGRMQGFLYDMNGKLILSAGTLILDFPFSTDSTGHFSTPVYARIKTWDTIWYNEAGWQYLEGNINPVTYNIPPDSVINRNIYLLSPILDGTTPQPKNTGSDFKVFYNSGSITVSFFTDLTNEAGNPVIEVYTMNGQKVIGRTLENKLGLITVPVELTGGVYIANLTSNDKIINSTRFIVTAE
jgi:hypothetical protein